jgi:hypothetical protein
LEVAAGNPAGYVPAESREFAAAITERYRYAVRCFLGAAHRLFGALPSSPGHMRPPGYEPRRSCTRVPPYSAEMQAPSLFSAATVHLGGTR